MGCTSTERILIRDATASAQTYASRAYSYLQGILGGTRRYRTWFGAYTDFRKGIVQEHFRLINSRQFSSFTYDCTCNDPRKFAYVCAYIFQSRGYIVLSLSDLLIRSQRVREDLPLRCLLEGTQHRYGFEGWNARP